MREEFFDERNDLIDAPVETLFGLRVDEKDRAVGFNFSDEEKVKGVNKFDECRGSVPGVEDGGDKGEIFV